VFPRCLIRQVGTTFRALSVRGGRDGISAKQWPGGGGGGGHWCVQTALPLVTVRLYVERNLGAVVAKKKKGFCPRTMILNVLFTEQELALMVFLWGGHEKSGKISQMEIKKFIMPL
jgi:hypothetical protein